MLEGVDSFDFVEAGVAFFSQTGHCNPRSDRTGNATCDRADTAGHLIPRINRSYRNSSTTISGLEPNLSGGPQVPAPLEVKTCIFPTQLNPYTNCR